jgi:hypothetical protein
VTQIGISGVRYTRRQLYYEFCRTLLPFARVVASWSSVAAVGSASVLAAWRRSRPLWSGIMGAGAWIAVPSLVRRLPFTLTPPVTDALFNEVLTAYCARHGEPPGLIPDDPAPWHAIDGREPDLYDYGLAYALVCQDASIARMLRANFLHMEMACAILAREEATPLPDALVAMLIRASSPRVLLVHDASLAGLRWITHAAELLDVPRGFRVRALGLRPMHALRRLRSSVSAARSGTASHARVAAPSVRSTSCCGHRRTACVAEPDRTYLVARRVSGGTRRPAPSCVAARAATCHSSDAAPRLLVVWFSSMAYIWLYELDCVTGRWL